jgi:hypothetical protein
MAARQAPATHTPTPMVLQHKLLKTTAPSQWRPDGTSTWYYVYGCPECGTLYERSCRYLQWGHAVPICDQRTVTLERPTQLPLPGTTTEEG